MNKKISMVVVMCFSAGLGLHAQDANEPVPRYRRTTEAVTNVAPADAVTNIAPAVAVTAQVPVDDISVPADTGSAGAKRWWSVLIPESIGTRVTYSKLTDSSRGEGRHYLGSISYLDEHHRYAPDKVFANWALCKHAFFEATWDQVKTDATGHHGADDSDGIINMSGPIFTLVSRFPNGSAVTPYAGVGVAVWNASFDHAYWHRLGYQSLADWQADGSPAPRHADSGRRHIFIDDNAGFVATAGLDWHLSGHWSVDLYGRYIDIDTRYHYQIVNGDGSLSRNSTGHFPMSNYAGGLGVRYSF